MIDGMGIIEKPSWKHSKRWNFWSEHGFGMEICLHAEREPTSHWDFPRQWNTYLMFSDKLKFSRGGTLCKPYVEVDPMLDYLWTHRDALDPLEGWNGGQTFQEFFTYDDSGLRCMKIGDDFQHLWDGENRRYEMYDLEYMQRRIVRTANEAAERLRFLMKQSDATHAARDGEGK